MHETLPALSDVCIFDDEPRYEVNLYSGEHGTWSWVVSVAGRTIGRGGGDDLDAVVLKAERFVQDRIEDDHRQWSIL